MSKLHDIFIYKIVKIHERIGLLFYGTRAKLDALFWSIEFGHKCMFYGHTRFKRALGSKMTIGNNCRFRSAMWSNQIGLNRPCMVSTVKKGAQINIGNDCGMSGTVIAAADQITIGNGVLCGANVTITDTDWHSVGIDKSKSGNCAPINIEDNVWLGLNVIVFKGVTIGRNSIIGAGSIVTKSIPAGVLAVGQPAKVIKKLK